MSPLVSCFLLGLSTVVHSDIVGPPDFDVSQKLSWLTETRMELNVGGIRRMIWLTPTTNIPGLNTPCLFKGTLEGDPESEVSVSGCHDSEETSVSIASSLLPDGIVDLMIVDGITTNFDSHSMDIEGGEDTDYFTADNLFPQPNNAESASDFWSGPLPSRVVLKTNIKYDNSLLEHFGYSHKKTKDWINKVVDLARPKMSHYSLSIRVVLEIGEISHIDETLRASEPTIRRLSVENMFSWKSHNVLTSYFCKDIGGGDLGIAFEGAACHPFEALNIVELSTTIGPDLDTAKTFAHELGHNIGMKHDFDEKHGGDYGNCNHLGLMSYGRNRPSKWSSCSDADFKTWWREKGHACVRKI